MPFHNPYNFLPAIPHSDGLMPDGLGAGAPAGHHRWHQQLLSGSLDVQMSVITPQLVMREREIAGDHTHLEVATTPDVDGVSRVDLPASSIKGMLRAAFEAVTNSRLGVFDHQTRLGYRTPVDDARNLRPVLVHGQEIEFLGRLTLAGQRMSAAVPVAAWGVDEREYLLDEFTHRQPVEAFLVPVTKNGRTTWQVQALMDDDYQHDLFPEPGGDWVEVRGVLWVSGPSISTKRAERLFVTEIIRGNVNATQERSRRASPGEAERLLAGLQELIEHQRTLHQHANSSAITDRTGNPWDYLGDEPGRTAWSRHLYDTGSGGPAWLGPDTTIGTDHPLPCWAETLPGDCQRLRPVTVARALHAAAPVDLLDKTLRPATCPSDLTAADRVFGWTAPDETGAHRGQLRVLRLTCPEADAIENIEPLTLPPLSSPKPSQGRFYLGEPDDHAGIRPLAGNLRRAELFAGGQVVRGRKVYPHQQWMENATTDDIARRARYTPPENRSAQDTQNATIHNWIPRGTQFTFTIEFHDLHPMELGALLWLLDPHSIGDGTRPGRHRLGWGKPLGFGSVELTISRSTVHTGQQTAHRLHTLGAEQPTTDTTDLAAEFEREMNRRSPLRGLLAAFQRAAAGYPADQPVHYPRNRLGEPGYEWFTTNENRAATGKAQSLPPLGGPMLEENG